MKIRVNPHNVEIIKEQTEPVNEKEIKISKCEFEFDEEITNDFVKEAYFTLNGETYKQIIQNNQCDYPNEVLTQKGTLEIGVVAYKIENEQEIIRYNPSPDYYETWIGSLKDAENSEPITPTDKEQIEQQLLNITTQMDNLDVDASKEEHKTTITITKKDGSTNQVEVLDGEKGDKGDKGEPGAIEMIIVAELPETGQDDTIYLVPLESPTEEGNNYAEYVYIDGAWELLGKIGVQVDLSDYYTKSETNSLVNAKYTKPSTGIPKTDLDSSVQTSLNKADSAIQDVSNKEDKLNKVTTLSSSSTDTQYPSAKCVYDSQQAQDNASKIFINNIFNLKNYFQHQVQTGTEVSLNGTLEKAPMELMLKGNTEQDTTTGKNLFDISKVLNNGANLVNNGDGTLTVKAYGISGASPSQLKALAPTLQVNDVVYLYADSTSTNKFVYLMGTNQIWNFGDSRTITQQDLDSTVLWYGVSGSSTAYIVSNIMITKTQGATYEEYTGGMASPNPDYPQEVKVVTGYNEISVHNQNFLDNSKIVKGRLDNGIIGYESGTTSLETTNNSITFTTNTNYRGVVSDFIEIKNTTYIILSYKNATASLGFTVNYYDENKNYLTQNAGYSITNGLRYPNNINNAKYIRIYFSLNTAGTVSIEEPQVEFTNNLTQTTYVKDGYKNYEINLGKNLLPNNQTTQTINGITFTINTDKSISVSGTSTAQTDLYLVGDASQYINLGLEAGNYNLSGVNNGSLSTYMLYCVQNRNGELSYYQSYTVQGLNISVQSGDTFRIFIRVLNGQTVNTVIYPQLEKGTSATSYAPYFTPIELCKIGYYQDYLYKENGNWYKDSAIGKVVLDGSETWTSMGWTGRNGYWTSISNLKNTTSTTETSYIISNYFQVLTQTELYDAPNPNYSISNRANQSQIIIRKDDSTTENDFKTWLSLHNTNVYYVLATLTPTQITEQTLINQLNAIEQAYSYSNQTNITQTNSNLPFIITADMMLEM